MPRFKHDDLPPLGDLVGDFRERYVYKVYKVREAFDLNKNERYDPTDPDEALDWEGGETYIAYKYLDDQLVGNPERISPRKIRAFMEEISRGGR